MSDQPFDSSIKNLVDAYPDDWAAFLQQHLGLSPGPVVPLDADLGSVPAAADKVFRYLPPRRGLLHLESQAGHERRLPRRVFKYNVLLEIGRAHV